MKTPSQKSTATGRKPTGRRNAGAPGSTGRAAAELEAITEMARAVGAAADAEDTYARITDAARRVLEFDRVVVARIEPGGRSLTCLFVSGDGEPATASGVTAPLKGTLAEAAIEAGTAVGAGLQRPKARAGGDASPAAIAAPLVFKGVSTGSVTFESSKTRRYSAQDIRFVERVATLLSGAMSNESLEQALEREGRERLVLSKIGEVMGSSLELDDVFEQFADEVKQLLPLDRITVSTIDGAQDTCTIMCVSGTYIPGLEPGEVLQLSTSLAGEVIERRRSLTLTDNGGQDASAGSHATPWEFGAGIRSILVAPLVSRNETIGILQIGSNKPDAYSTRDVILAERIGAQFAGSVANSQLYLQSLQLSEERDLRARADAENRELLRVNEEKNKFTSLVSHELRSPLTSMLAFADLLARNKEGNLTDRQAQWVDAVRRGGRTMNVLVDDLLNLSRIEAGTFKLERREFDARSTLKEQVESLTAVAESKDQTITASLPDEPCWVDADPDRFGQIISNLLSNASKYSPESSELGLEARTDGDRLHVTVRDRGIGISEEDQRQLFTAFFRAGNKETRAEKGTGLGLCITKSLVEMHGGQINVESKPGAGTTVSFNIRGVLPGPPNARDDTASFETDRERPAPNLADARAG